MRLYPRLIPITLIIFASGIFALAYQPTNYQLKSNTLFNQPSDEIPHASARVTKIYPSFNEDSSLNVLGATLVRVNDTPTPAASPSNLQFSPNPSFQQLSSTQSTNSSPVILDPKETPYPSPSSNCMVRPSCLDDPRYACKIPEPAEGWCPTPSSTPHPFPTPSGSNTEPKPSCTPSSTPSAVICAQDTRQCPDGSWVARIAPNCEFAQCQGQNLTVSATPEPTPSLDCDARIACPPGKCLMIPTCIK